MLRVVLNPRAAAVLRKLAPETQAEVVAALRQMTGAFGRPHVHAGLGLRQLRPGLYGIRACLDLRAVLQRDGDDLVVKIIGGHSAVRDYLRNIS